MIKAVILDWAGTMVDFGSRAPVSAMQEVLAAAGAPVDEPLVRRFMGMAKREHVTAMLQDAAVTQRWEQVHGRRWSEADIDTLMAALEPAMQTSAAACSDLVPGALDVIAALRSAGVRIGSTTGYTRTMMGPIREKAARQGYAPDCVICADDTVQGRPAPLMLWKAMVELGVWPADAVVVVDDATAGVEAGRTAGCWTVAVAASGNALGLSYPAFLEASPETLRSAYASASSAFAAAGADFVIAGVADLPGVLSRIAARFERGDKPGAAAAEILLPVR